MRLLIALTKANIVTLMELATMHLQNATEKHRATATQQRSTTGWEDQMLFVNRLYQRQKHDRESKR